MKLKLDVEVKKVVGQVKKAQAKFQEAVKSRANWIEDARKYAESQGKEVRKLIAGDFHKVKNFLERERKELDRFQKRLPTEIRKLKTYVNAQKREFEKILRVLRTTSAQAKGAAKGASKKKRSAASRSVATRAGKKAKPARVSASTTGSTV